MSDIAVVAVVAVVDVVAVVLLLRYAARAVPAEVLFAAWPAEPRLLARVIGQW